MTSRDERLYLTRRLGLLRRLTDEGVSPQRGETLVAAWEAEAERRGLDRLTPTFWRNGAAWVANERRTQLGEGSDLLRQVKDGLDDARRQPTKELGLPDEQEHGSQESAKRDDAWKHQRDDSARVRRRRR